ncbi:MAG: phosphoribosylformylglycinamidine synthase I [Planctomycetes bacterium]|nr:phosphoribosylformylglycinamidine synthase I [Planctomycetota bacterium]
MAEPRVLVLRAAGINCELETQFAFERAGAPARIMHVNRLLERPDTLNEYGMVVVPGGFSYGDDIAAGKVLAVEISHALGDHFRAFVARGGLMLGICNGFQVLVKTGLLPGVGADGASRHATVTWNDSHRYEDRWVHLTVDAGLCVFAPRDRSTLTLPVAHGEGRFTVGADAEIESLAAARQVVFRYVASDGTPPHYPANPNGSMGHVAGICDPTGQVLGLMPHPERALFPWHHPAWTRDGSREEGDGAALFRAAVKAMR